MDPKKIDEYRARLDKERLKFIDELMKEETPEDFGSDVGHSDEETDEAETLGDQLAIGQIMRQRINEIDAALNKIKDGKYGICEKCGEQIEEEVLGIAPESRYCRNCKKK